MRKTFGLAMAVVAAVLAMLFAGAATPSATATVHSSQPAKELTLDLGDKITLKLVPIPPGKFLMGSPETEKDRVTDETQHEVTISKSFFMGMTHVTVDQFAAFVKDSSYKTEAEKEGNSFGFDIKDGQLNFNQVAGCSWRNPGFEQKGDHPVVQVSWNDAQVFCGWLSKKSGKSVVLPTEAQWEYASRAGSKAAYAWGDNPDDGKIWANGADQSLKRKVPNMPTGMMYFSWDDGFVFTSPVGTFKANAFGLQDMTGNAFQWCQDYLGGYKKGADTDPIGAPTGVLRVMRGGSWDGTPKVCRSARRIMNLPTGRASDVGFRVVVAADVN